MEWNLQTRETACFTPAASHTSEERFSADCVVPDTLPDVERLLLASGEFCLWRLDLDEGSAELEGEIRCDVLCQAEGGGLMSFPVSVPVLVRVRDAALSPTLRPFPDLCLTELTPQLMNSRKVRLTARVRAALTAYAPETLVLTEAAESDAVLQQRTRVCFEPVTAVEEQVFSAADTVALSGAPEQLLAARSTVLTDDVQCVGQRVILQGRVRTELLYLAAEPVSEIVETPFSQLIDTDAGQEIVSAQAQVHLTSVHLSLLPEEQAMEVEAHLVAQVLCRSRVEAELLTDVYSNRTLLEAERATLSLPLPAQQEQQRVFAEAEVNCDPGYTTIAARAVLGAPGSAEAILLRRDGDGAFTALRQELRYALPEGCAVRSAAAGDLSVTPAAEGVRLRLPVTLELERRERHTVTQITAITGEAPNAAAAAMPSLTLLRAGENPDLWQIAKAHASTVAAIRAANPEDGQRTYLAVPKVL